MIVDVFITYVKQDYNHFNKINNGLVVIKNHFLQENKVGINYFHKGIITPGKKIDDEIKNNLDKSNIILLLISRKFLEEATKDPFRKEFKAVVKKHIAEKAIVIPILLSSCLWNISIFKDVQPLPRDMTPIDECRNRNKAYNDLDLELLELISKYIDRREQKDLYDDKIVQLNPKPTEPNPNNLLKMVDLFLEIDKLISINYKYG